MHTKFILKNLWFYLFANRTSWLWSCMTTPFSNPSNLCILFSLLLVGIFIYIFPPIVCLGLFRQLLNWMPLKITLIRNFETSFSQVRSWILLRSEWLVRMTGQSLIGSALSRPRSFASERESTSVTINSPQQMETARSGQFLFFSSIYMRLSKYLTPRWGNVIEKYSVLAFQIFCFLLHILRNRWSLLCEITL